MRAYVGEGRNESKQMEVNAVKERSVMDDTTRWKIKRQDCNRGNNGTSARDYARPLCAVRQTDLTARFTKELYLFRLYNRAPGPVC